MIHQLKTDEVERGLNNGRFYEKKYGRYIEGDAHSGPQELEEIGPYLVSFYDE